MRFGKWGLGKWAVLEGAQCKASTWDGAGGSMSGKGDAAISAVSNGKAESWWEMWGCALSAVRSGGQRGAREITLLVRQSRARELIKPTWLRRARKHREMSHMGNGGPSCHWGVLRAVRKQKKKKFPCREEWQVGKKDGAEKPKSSNRCSSPLSLLPVNKKILKCWLCILLFIAWSVQIFQSKSGWQNLPPALEIPRFWGDAEMHQKSYTRLSEKAKEQPMGYWSCRDNYSHLIWLAGVRNTAPLTKPLWDPLCRKTVSKKTGFIDTVCYQDSRDLSSTLGTVKESEDTSIWGLFPKSWTNIA